jgi:hypothetical protein
MVPIGVRVLPPEHALGNKTAGRSRNGLALKVPPKGLWSRNGHKRGKSCIPLAARRDVGVLQAVRVPGWAVRLGPLVTADHLGRDDRFEMIRIDARRVAADRLAPAAFRDRAARLPPLPIVAQKRCDVPP